MIRFPSQGVIGSGYRSLRHLCLVLPLDHTSGLRLPLLDRWWLICVALVAGGAPSWFCGLNLFALLPIPPVVGRVLTALLVGGGSPLIHVVVNKARVPAYPRVGL